MRLRSLEILLYVLYLVAACSLAAAYILALVSSDEIFLKKMGGKWKKWT